MPGWSDWRIVEKFGKTKYRHIAFFDSDSFADDWAIYFFPEVFNDSRIP